MYSPQNAHEHWIDTAELKEKKRKRQTRPISKLLNPLARCGGYSVAVALNFTQSKLAMPATKQSTISTFFSPRRKDAENKPILSTEHCVNASNTAPIKSEDQRSTDFDCQTSMKNAESDFSDMTGAKGFKEQSSTVLERNHPNYYCDWEKEQTFLHLIRGYESDEDVEEPEEKQRATVACSVPSSADKQGLVHCHPIPETLALNHWDQNALGSQCLKTIHPKTKDSLFSGSQMSERDFRAELPFGECTSSQNKLPCPLRSHAKHSGKENSRSDTKKGKYLGYSRSPLKVRTPSPSLPAAKSMPLETRCQSPQRQGLKGARKEFETDSMASLFTQDSQGFRVIAHRHHQSRSPLKDRTNNASPGEACELSVGASPENSDQELEAEMLFTQDSQGNLVIKH